jgi:transcription initiation factor TFIIB
MEFSNNRTLKKKKNRYSEKEKERMWEIFDKEVKVAKNDDLECLYSREKLDVCEKCNSALLVMEDGGYPICTNKECGIIYKDILDHSPEWRFYKSEDRNSNDPTRCGNPINPLLVESSYGLKVLSKPGSSYEMKKIKRWTEWQSMPHREKALFEEFQFITLMAQNAGIPKIFIDHAITIHKDISEQQMFRGMNRDGIKAASIYLSCRLNGCPRTAHEIAEIFKLDKTSATNGCSMAVNILNNIERNLDKSMQTQLGIIKPISFIERFSSKLNYTSEMTKLGKFIANKLDNLCIITDNIPHAIAAGIVYFVGDLYGVNITKNEVKNITNVSEVTINKCYRKIDEKREKIIPPKILERIGNK